MNAISKRQYKMDMKEKNNKLLNSTSNIENGNMPKKEGMISLLTEIRDLLKETLDIIKQKNITSESI